MELTGKRPDEELEEIDEKKKPSMPLNSPVIAAPGRNPASLAVQTDDRVAAWIERDRLARLRKK